MTELSKLVLNPFHNICATAGTKTYLPIFNTILSILCDYILKTKYGKNLEIDFSIVLEHCGTFWTKNPIWSLLR